MINDSVTTDVALGLPIDRERVMQCLASANLAAFVLTLPQGIDTVMGSFQAASASVWPLLGHFTRMRPF